MPQNSCIVSLVVLQFLYQTVTIQAWIYWLRLGKRKTKALDWFKVFMFLVFVEKPFLEH